MHITIIGIGNVGSACAFGLIMQDIEILNIIDIDAEKLNSEFLDLKNSIDIFGRKTKLTKSIEIQKSDIYILSAGKNTGEIETRNGLYENNKSIAEHYFKEIAKLNPNAWVLVVTNPSHELAQHGLNYLSKVIPVGNMLDNARYKTYHLFGKHEQPIDLYKQIKKGKGYTNWGCAAEIIKLISSIQPI